jgi:cysteine desulfurase/selenocysteine lyase|tara:strand:+ start:4440 stop:5606 length:1167 start_codon:yes stop_codon:yes gene_type:complete
VNGKPLVYLDNGATTQKPQIVIDAISKYYDNENSNIHRGVHLLSQEATTAYEEARVKIQQFINAKHSHEVIFTSGTTGSINLISSSFGKKHIQKGDEIIITAMEHHSNIVPWQMLCEEKEAILKVIPINKKGELIVEEFKKLITEKTKLVSFTHTSNSLGTINPTEEIIKIAHANNALVLVDGAQAIGHDRVDMQKLDADFFVFSGHKLFGPTGTGILFGKEELLNDLPPYQGGGDMIKTVTFEKTTYNELPHKFEAGTPNIAGGIGIGAAIDYVNSIGFEFIKKQEKELLHYATQELRKINGLKIIGEAEHKTSVISFVVDGVHPFDIGVILDKLGIAIRTGHHCTQPLMDFFEIPGTARASFSFYNTKEEVDILISGLNRALGMLL